MKYRSIFISDVHLGTRDSQAEALLEFFKEYESEYFYLVGDIIDGWSLKRKWTWPQAHSDVIQKTLRKARKGTKVYYVLGNHDEFVRPFLPVELGDNLEVVDQVEHTGADGKKYLVVHGDLFDSITMTKKWLAILGDIGYQMLLRVNRPVNFFRKRLGYKYWSFSQFIKENVKRSVMFITDFENILAAHAKDNEFEGVICGHIHKAEIRDINGIKYMNCGDWVESCTALVETYDGEWKIIHEPIH